MYFSRSLVAPVMILARSGRLLAHDYWLEPGQLAPAPAGDAAADWESFWAAGTRAVR